MNDQQSDDDFSVIHINTFNNNEIIQLDGNISISTSMNSSWSNSQNNTEVETCSEISSYSDVSNKSSDNFNEPQHIPVITNFRPNIETNVTSYKYCQYKKFLKTIKPK